MKSLKIGIAGLGNVGEEVAYRLLMVLRFKNLFDIEIIAVSAKSKDKKRKVDISNIDFYDNPLEMASNPNLDLVIELIGGDEGVAKDLCFASLENKKGLITANKALIAKYGKDLATLAEKNNLFFSFSRHLLQAVSQY